MIDSTKQPASACAAETTSDLMQDASEVIRYDEPGIPLYIRQRRLSEYPDMRALCHWHEDLELIQIQKGRMHYQIGETTLLLEEGDCLFVNSRRMHYGYSCRRQECVFLCILFHPGLFTENSLLRRQYIRPFTSSQAPDHLRFGPDDPFYPEISRFMRKLRQLKQAEENAFQLEAAGLIHLFWNHLLRTPQMSETGFSKEEHPDLALLKDMVSFIACSYPEKISLDDIARAGNVSRSKCCILFNRYLKQSPVAFLNQYRLKVSCRLLEHSGESITQIAAACGFNHPSYYGKCFQECYGSRPNQYRKRQ